MAKSSIGKAGRLNPNRYSTRCLVKDPEDSLREPVHLLSFVMTYGTLEDPEVI